MADSNTHIINRINASIFCDQQNAGLIQELGMSSCIIDGLEKVLPLLDEMFGAEVVRLEELNLSLDIDASQLSNFSDVLKKSLKEALSELEKKDRSISKSNYKERPKLEPHQVFLYFLKNGQLPWFAANMEYREAYLTKPDFKAQCLTVLKSSSSAGKRLIQQFTKDELFSVLTTLYPSKFISTLFDFTDFISENTHRFSERYAAGFRLRQFLLSRALGYLQKTNHSFGLHDFLSCTSNDIVSEIKKECNGQHPYFIEAIREELAKGYQIQIDFEKSASDSLTVAKEMSSTLQKGIPEEQEHETPDPWKEVKKEDQQLVLNAGMVLLHPFIKRFFKKVGLLENDLFISPAHQQRAICLLHNLATGELEFPEEKLLFYKFLCHYPLDQPIPKELPISDFELEEVQQVLQSAIGHWKALKRTSVAGLRANFLQRKGLLEKDALGYTLHVEGQTADILLDQLPWGLSAAHWPWLPHLLTIKWR